MSRPAPPVESPRMPPFIVPTSRWRRGAAACLHARADPLFFLSFQTAELSRCSGATAAVASSATSPPRPPPWGYDECSPPPRIPTVVELEARDTLTFAGIAEARRMASKDPEPGMAEKDPSSPPSPPSQRPGSATQIWGAETDASCLHPRPTVARASSLPPWAAVGEPPSSSSSRRRATTKLACARHGLHKPAGGNYLGLCATTSATLLEALPLCSTQSLSPFCRTRFCRWTVRDGLSTPYIHFNKREWYD
jgi:hypothetical protein